MLSLLSFPLRLHVSEGSSGSKCYNLGVGGWRFFLVAFSFVLPIHGHSTMPHYNCLFTYLFPPLEMWVPWGQEWNLIHLYIPSIYHGVCHTILTAFVELNWTILALSCTSCHLFCNRKSKTAREHEANLLNLGEDLEWFLFALSSTSSHCTHLPFFTTGRLLFVQRKVSNIVQDFQWLLCLLTRGWWLCHFIQPL